MGVFLDLKKTFDTIDHKIQKKLSYGNRGNIFKWVENYLTDGYQYVVYNGVQSNYLPIMCGVPQ